MNGECEGLRQLQVFDRYLRTMVVICLLKIMCSTKQCASFMYNSAYITVEELIYLFYYTTYVLKSLKLAELTEMFCRKQQENPLLGAYL